METLVRGNTLRTKDGALFMVRRIEAPGPRDISPQVVLWSVAHGVELTRRYALSYLLERLEDRSMRRGRTLDAARVIHEATERNRRRSGAA
jgi:hypothetical protein